MGTPADDGSTRRDYLLAAWRRDRLPETYAQLMGPDAPEWMDYLVEWARELHGRSGHGSASLLPVSESELRAFAENRGVTLHPLEIEALIALDAVLRHPEEAVKAELAPTAPVRASAWPAKKVTRGD